MNAPRFKEGGFYARMEGRPELWIGGLYMIGPFLAKYGKITRVSKYIDEAFLQHEVHVKRLVDP